MQKCIFSLAQLPALNSFYSYCMKTRHCESVCMSRQTTTRAQTLQARQAPLCVTRTSVCLLDLFCFVALLGVDCYRCKKRKKKGGGGEFKRTHSMEHRYSFPLTCAPSATSSQCTVRIDCSVRNGECTEI